jgi:hypothetical protein
MGGGGIWLQCVVRQQCLQQKYEVCSGKLQVQWNALGYYKVSHMFEHDIATYVSLNCLEIKVSFGYDVPILVDYTYAKNEPSEHMESKPMSIGANCAKIRICRNNLRLLAVFNMT